MFQRGIIYSEKNEAYISEDFSSFFFFFSFCKALWKFSLTTSVFLADIWRSHDVGMKFSPCNSARRVLFCSIVQYRKLRFVCNFSFYECVFLDS